MYSPEAVSAPPGELILGTGKWTIPLGTEHTATACHALNIRADGGWGDFTITHRTCQHTHGHRQVMFWQSVTLSISGAYVHAIETIRLDFPQKKRYEGVSVTRDGCRVGVNFPGKKRYVTPEWPPKEGWVGKCRYQSYDYVRFNVINVLL